MEMNWKSFSSKLCHEKILFECGMVTRWNPLSSKFGAEQPGVARPPYSQPRFIGMARCRVACEGAVWAAACQRAAAPLIPATPPLRKPLRLKESIDRGL